MRDPYSPDRLKESSTILATFLPNSRLTIANDHTNRPYVTIETTTHYPDGIRRSVQPAIPSSSGSALSGRSGRLRFGGTAEEGIATLIRFVRGRTRRPLSWWAARFPERTYRALIATTYGDEPEKMACVLCGRPEPGMDWHATNRWDQGPCCAFAACSGGVGRAKPADASVGTLDGLLGEMFGGMDDRMIYRGVEHDA